MKKTEIAIKASQMISKTKLGIKKHSPEILVASGIVAGVAGAVLACKSTVKATEVVADAQKKLSDIEEAKILAENGEVIYTDDDEANDRKTVAVGLTVDMAKLYALPVALGVVSITCILASNHILNKRNVALSAAYAALNTDFGNYRKRVIEKYGKEEDFMLKNGLEKKLVATEVVDPETGEVKKEETEVLTYNGDKLSQYARIFDEIESTQWSPNPDRNKQFLLMEQNFFNEKIKTRGYIFLNEVYERLGFRPTKAGAVVGWVYKNEDWEGIDFGLFTATSPKVKDFMNGDEASVILDFNVQGDVLSLVTEGGVWDAINS